MKEVAAFMKQRRAYINNDGSPIGSISNATLELVLFNLAGIGR